ncbi:MAG: hypothetical protein EP348_06985 [Alphaproteobacteria bacterium]|nr:MAG: hypothetical protein EP348_06985 [Alphaproteobacteria bacterium]
MADDDFPEDDYYDGEEEVPGLSRKRWIGAILALIIVGGFGIGIWYAYDQGVKKGVQLAPPIIKADSTPVKEKPADPGGMDIPNQDKQVFGLLNSSGGDEKVEKLMAPPEDALPDEQKAETPPQETATGKPETLIGKADEAAKSAESTDEKAAMTEKKLPALNDGGTVEKPEAKAPEMAEKTPEPVKKAEEPVKKAAEPVKKAVQTASSGPKYRVQLGSFTSTDAAEKQWSQLRSKYKSLLADVGYRIEDVDVKGKAYHRLQAGAYDSRDGANSLCSKLKAQKQDCLVVSG